MLDRETECLLRSRKGAWHYTNREDRINATLALQDSYCPESATLAAGRQESTGEQILAIQEWIDEFFYLGLEMD